MKLLRLLLLLGCSLAAIQALAEHPRRLLLVGQGPDNHPRGTHEYLVGVERLARLLEKTPDLEIRIANGDEPWTDGPKLLADCDGVVIFVSEGAKWCLADPRRHEALAQLAARGGGLATIHWGMGTRAAEPIAPFQKLFGGCHGGPDRKYQVIRGELRPAEPLHPIARGLKPLEVRDEFYYRLKFVDAAPGVEPVMQALIDGEPQTVAWAWQRPDGGRSFGFSGLHFDENWELDQYRRLMSRGVLWTLKLPLD